MSDKISFDEYRLKSRTIMSHLAYELINKITANRDILPEQFLDDVDLCIERADSQDDELFRRVEK